MKVSISAYVDNCPQQIIRAVHHTIQTWMPVDLACGHSASVNSTVNVGDTIGCTECAKRADRGVSMNDILWALTPEDYAICSPTFALPSTDSEMAKLSMIATDQRDMQTMIDLQNGWHIRGPYPHHAMHLRAFIGLDH